MLIPSTVPFSYFLNFAVGSANWADVFVLSRPVFKLGHFWAWCGTLLIIIPKPQIKTGPNLSNFRQRVILNWEVHKVTRRTEQKGRHRIFCQLRKFYKVVSAMKAFVLKWALQANSSGFDKWCGRLGVYPRPAPLYITRIFPITDNWLHSLECQLFLYFCSPLVPFLSERGTYLVVLRAYNL